MVFFLITDMLETLKMMRKIAFSTPKNKKMNMKKKKAKTLHIAV